MCETSLFLVWKPIKPPDKPDYRGEFRTKNTNALRREKKYYIKTAMRKKNVFLPIHSC